MRKYNLPQISSQHAEKLASFRRQMADFARGERLKELRDARHLSQEDAAHEIGISVRALRTWEKGGGIRWRNAKAAAAFYGVAPESLVSREIPDEEVPMPLEPDLRELVAELRQTRAELLAAIEVVRRGQASLLRHQGLDEPRQGGKHS